MFYFYRFVIIPDDTGTEEPIDNQLENRLPFEGEPE